MSGVFFEFGAGNETRTRDPDLGKTGRYQVNQVDRPSNRASRANEIKWLPLPTCQLLANVGFSPWMLLPVLAGLEFEQALRDASVNVMGLMQQRARGTAVSNPANALFVWLIR